MQMSFSFNVMEVGKRAKMTRGLAWNALLAPVGNFIWSPHLL